MIMIKLRNRMKLSNRFVPGIMDNTTKKTMEEKRKENKVITLEFKLLRLSWR